MVPTKEELEQKVDQLNRMIGKKQARIDELESEEQNKPRSEKVLELERKLQQKEERINELRQSLTHLSTIVGELKTSDISRAVQEQITQSQQPEQANGSGDWN